MQGSWHLPLHLKGLLTFYICVASVRPGCICGGCQVARCLCKQHSVDMDTSALAQEPVKEAAYACSISWQGMMNSALTLHASVRCRFSCG